MSKNVVLKNVELVKERLQQQRLRPPLLNVEIVITFGADSILGDVAGALEFVAIAPKHAKLADEVIDASSNLVLIMQC